MAIDFTYRSRFDENANFTMVRWGADSPVPEVELNEMQDISEGKLRDVVKATFGNGLLGVGTVEYDEENKTLKIKNEKAFIEGYLLNIESLETRVTKDVPVRLNCWKEVITAESKIYKHGNLQSDVIPNKLIDERYGKEITRREQIVFNLESDDNPNTHKDKGYSLEIGSLKDLINKETGEKYVGFDVVAEKASVDAASIGKTFCFSKDTPETDEEEYLWFKQLESDDDIPTENVKEFDMVLLKVNQKEGTTEVYYPKVKWSSIIDLPDNIVYSREVADTEIPSPVNINNSGLEIGMFTVTYGNNVPAGYVEANGQEINRIVYADLLDYAKSVGLVISEADWQAKFTAQSGLVTEYGYDDGSATFRVPRIVGDSSLSEKRIIKAFGSLGDGVANYQDVIEAMKDYMPLAGGAMTGTLITRNVNDKLLALTGGTNSDNGASAMLYGRDNSEGRFIFRANDGTSHTDLVGTPDGTLTWNGKEIVRSVNGVGADSAGNVDVNTFAVGDIKWSSADLTQVGFLVANGAEVGRATYPDLCAVYESMGFPWGAGDGSTTFNLPNLIGKFAEGADSAGGYHEAGLPNITGSVGDPSLVSDGLKTATGVFLDSTMNSGNGYNGGAVRGLSIKFDASNSNPIYGNSDTVQPPSALLIPYVKAFAGASVDSTDLAITEVANDVARISERVYLVESAVNDDGSWYRKYSDGWLEQGGRIDNGKTTNTPITVNLLKAMANADYCVNLTSYSDVRAGTGSDLLSTRTDTYFTAYVIYNESGKYGSWSVCGMGAE